MAVANTCMRSHSALLMYERFLLVFAVHGFANFANCSCSSRREKTVYVETAALCCLVLNDRVLAYCEGGGLVVVEDGFLCLKINEFASYF